MKSNFRSYWSIILLLFLSTILNAQSLVDFQDVRPSEVSEYQKKIFISFSANWCLPCKMIDESIFMDEEITKFLNEHFVNIKADIDTQSGREWKDAYDVLYLPTSLLALEDGQEVHRQVGVPSRDEFLNMLYNFVKGDNIDINKLTVNTTTATENTNSTKATPPEHIVIQVGAFSLKENAQRLLSKLNSNELNNTSIAEHYVRNEKTLYRVFLSGYRDRKEARQVLLMIRKNGFEGFIKMI